MNSNRCFRNPASVFACLLVAMLFTTAEAKSWDIQFAAKAYLYLEDDVTEKLPVDSEVHLNGKNYIVTISDPVKKGPFEGGTFIQLNGEHNAKSGDSLYTGHHPPEGDD